MTYRRRSYTVQACYGRLAEGEEVVTWWLKVAGRDTRIPAASAQLLLRCPTEFETPTPLKTAAARVLEVFGAEDCGDPGEWMSFAQRRALRQLWNCIRGGEAT